MEAFRSLYLPKEINAPSINASFHQVDLFFEFDAELVRGNGHISFNPNTCTLTKFGDTDICTKKNPFHCSIELIGIKEADPLDLGRNIYEVNIDGNMSDPRTYLVIHHEDKCSIRLVIENAVDSHNVIPLFRI